MCRMLSDAAALRMTTLRWTADERRRRGRPKETWGRTAKKDMRECGSTLETLSRRAAGRQQWRSFEEAFVCAAAGGHTED